MIEYTEMSSLAPPPAIDYKTLVQDDRIHASLYTDPRIFDDEMERIFRRGWVFVGHDSEIPAAGDFVTRRVGSEPVIPSRRRVSGNSSSFPRARGCSPSRQTPP